jgi:hypothetical protein
VAKKEKIIVLLKYFLAIYIAYDYMVSYSISIMLITKHEKRWNKKREIEVSL